MIVAPRFPGDDDRGAMDAQHEAYGAALGVIVGGCLRHMKNALLLTSQEVPPAIEDLLYDGRFDHRIVQAAHDHLAAYWRYATKHFDPALPFDFAAQENVISEWLSWLRREVERWGQHDHSLVRMVVAAVSSGGAEGIDAADGLLLSLRTRYALPTKLT